MFFQNFRHHLINERYRIQTKYIFKGMPSNYFETLVITKRLTIILIFFFICYVINRVDSFPATAVRNVLCILNVCNNDMFLIY